MFPERFVPGASDPLAQYLPARRGAVPDEVIPDLTAYDIDAVFLKGAGAPGTVVVAARAAEEGTGLRLVVLEDGSLKAVDAAGVAVVGRPVAELGGRVYDVTPEGGMAQR